MAARPGSDGLGKQLLLIAAIAAAAFGQTPSPTAQAAFEVTSVKPSNSADRRPLFNMANVLDGGQLTASKVTVKSLIRLAYRIKDFQISSGPGWIGSNLFDVAAKPAGRITQDQLSEMLQSLLAERFQLAIRRETRETAGYALTVAKGGLKIKEAHETDPIIPQLAGRTDLPAGRGRMRVSIIRRGRLTTQGTDMAGLAAQLADIIGRPVVDKTGLTGSYDLMLEWAPDENQVANFQAIGVPEGFGAPPPDWQGPTLFTALQEQLGLTLESQRTPVEMFVIERAEKPSAN